MKQLLISMLIFIATTTYAAQDLYPFKTAQQQQQFDTLTQELRCLVCQNENLAASDAKLASDLRHDVYQMVLQGKTNTEIKDYMVARYGDFILFNPPLVARTYILWFAPMVMLLFGFLLLWRVSRKYQKRFE